MEGLITLYFFILGLIFGSFFNVVGLRVPKGESLIRPGSHCPQCNHPLAWYELIPFFSYLLLRGKCKVCKNRISPIYPLMEGLTGILFAFSFWRFGWSSELVASLLLISLFMIITVSDLKYMLIPNKVLLFFLPIFILYRVFNPLTPWWDSILGAFLGFGILYLLAVISRGGMGGGDIKLYFVLGLLLGSELTLLSLFFSSLIGSIFGLGLLVTKNFKKRNPIPFGPFIAAGTILSFFYGEMVLDWYMNLFLSAL